MNDSIAAALHELNEESCYSVQRFDTGADIHPRVAVLPSAFNPPTLAHLRLLELGRTVEDVFTSAALLSTNNVDKGLYGAPLSDRIGMLLALRDPHPDLVVLATNAARIMDQGATLQSQHPGVGFDFVVGFDTLTRIFDPRYYDGDMAASLEPFFRDHRLIAMNRADWTVDDVKEFLTEPVVRDFQERILIRQLADECIWESSTQERKAVERGRVPRGVAPQVADYILRRGLYRKDTGSR